MKFAIAVFVINALVILAFIVEAVRTGWWRGLPSFDIGDIRHLIVAASSGGPDIGDAASRSKENRIGRAQVRLAKSDEGRMALLADERGDHDERSPIIMDKTNFSATVEVASHGRSDWKPGWI
jgi:hypothetical protein